MKSLPFSHCNAFRLVYKFIGLYEFPVTILFLWTLSNISCSLLKLNTDLVKQILVIFLAIQQFNNLLLHHIL